jgi:hypothetical protein
MKEKPRQRLDKPRCDAAKTLREMALRLDLQSKCSLGYTLATVAPALVLKGWLRLVFDCIELLEGEIRLAQMVVDIGLLTPLGALPQSDR